MPNDTLTIPSAAGVAAAVTSTLSGIAGGIGVLGSGLFSRPGPTYRAQLTIDADTEAPGIADVFRPGSPIDAVVRFAAAEESTEPGASVIRTACIKLPDFHGQHHDQDFLLASSADGIPFHHAVLPAAAPGDPIYSSLWLYLSGVQPVVFGLRSEQLSSAGDVGRGDRFTFLVASAVSRFKPAGSLDIGDQMPDATVDFAARNSGGGLRPLPPALFYRS
jgi:hypothetical protein